MGSGGRVPKPRHGGGLATYHVLHADATTHYLADNPAIHAHYRHRMTPWEALRSALQLHNETVNVWTHLGGALLFVGLLARLVVTPLLLDDGRPAAAADAAAAPRVVPTWPIAVFLASAITCLGSSAAYHLLHVVDRAWNATLSSLDYASIAVLIAGSTVPPIYYGFWCSPAQGWAYIAACGLLAAATMAMGMTPSFRTPSWRLVRTMSFIATGAFGVVPLLHLMRGPHAQYAEAMEGLLLMGGLYIFGALLYGFRVPERYWPGRFDLGGASHNVRGRGECARPRVRAL